MNDTTDDGVEGFNAGAGDAVFAEVEDLFPGREQSAGEAGQFADPTLDAGVAYYGMQPDPADVPKIKAPLLLQYAGIDDRVNAGIDAYKAAMEKEGKEFQLYMYEGANHAFNNDTNAARYNKEAADLAWGRTVAFLKKHAGGMA